jgi:DNA-binding NarL/FixJ family response regulator
MIVDRRCGSWERQRARLSGAGYDVQHHAAPLGTAKAALRSRPDVLVLDVEMSPLSVDQVIGILRARSSEMPILLLGDGERALASEAIRLGTAGYVVRDDNGEALLAAVERAIQGRVRRAKPLPGRRKAREEEERDLPSFSAYEEGF